MNLHNPRCENVKSYITLNSSAALGPIQPPVQWVSHQDLKLNTHIYVVPSANANTAVHSTPHGVNEVVPN
jgi:hypothetical protein